MPGAYLLLCTGPRGAERGLGCLPGSVLVATELRSMPAAVTGLGNSFPTESCRSQLVLRAGDAPQQEECASWAE